MTTSALAAAAITQTLTEFTDDISLALGDGVDYCGARTYSIDNGPLLSISGNVITLDSTSLADTGTYTVTVTASLASFPSATGSSQ